MSDIVERLRHTSGFADERLLRREAADEIERLRLDAENGWAARDHWKQKCQAADAVIEAARDARSEYFTAYPTEGELLKRMQALDAALRKLRE